MDYNQHYTFEEKIKIASFLGYVIKVDKYFTPVLKSQLFEVLNVIGMTLKDLQSIKYVDKNNCIEDFVKLPKSKRIDFYIIIIKIVGRNFNVLSNSQKAAFYLLFEYSRYGVDISDQDIVNVNLDFHGVLYLFRNSYREYVEANKHSNFEFDSNYDAPHTIN